MDREPWSFPDLAETDASSPFTHPRSDSGLDSGFQFDGAGDVLALPSRRRVIDRFRDDLRERTGPILITGEPGSGKTWLWRRLAELTSGSFRWACVDLTPALSVREFFLRLTHALGLGDAASFGDPRLILADFLLDQAQDGRRWVFVVEEGQNLNRDLLEETRVLTNRLGRDDGFASLLLVGQTRLARELKRREFLPLDDRIIARAHLRPINADEAAALLRARWPRSDWPLERVERLHADAAGNPRRLLALGSAAHEMRPAAPERIGPDPEPRSRLEPDLGLGLALEPQPAPAPSPSSAPASVSSLDIDRLCAWPSMRLGGSAGKSSMKVEEDAVEVGWDWDETAVDSVEPLWPPSADGAVNNGRRTEPTPALEAEPSPGNETDAELEEDWDAEIEIGVEPREAFVPADGPQLRAIAATRSAEAQPQFAAPDSSAVIDNDNDAMVEEILIDPLAALQALEEWTRPRPSRLAVPLSRVPLATAPNLSDDNDGDDGDDDDGGGSLAISENPTSPASAAPLASGLGPTVGSRLWVEGQHAFAPYSQLFARQRPSRG